MCLKARVRGCLLLLAPFWASAFAGCASSGNVTSSGDLGSGSTDDMNVGSLDMGQGCGLVTCQSMSATCGPIGDGCGNAIDCGSCAGTQTCGGGGTLFQCGGMAGCVPLTCAQLGLQCGPAGDGCGGLLDCGSCATGQTCGG